MKLWKKRLVVSTVGISIVGFLGGFSCQSREPSPESALRARFEAFNDAWERRDMAFVRDYYAHDSDMLLFFERRQLLGWTRVEELYENMFAHAARGKVDSKVSNLKVEVKGNLGYVAANFHLKVTEPSGDVSEDIGRQSVVFENRNGRWVVVHRHTSFQAPPGPQRKVPMHTEPGPLWSPNLEGTWRSQDGEILVATASHLAFLNAPGLPSGARYRLDERVIHLEAIDGMTAPVLERLDVAALSSRQMTFILPDETTEKVWDRVE
jgi:ketosteroid isomerase-like protein